MDSLPITHEAWLDRLLIESDAPKRMGVSMQMAMALTACQGVSQWIESAPGAFQAQREVGLTDPELDPAIVALVAQGSWDPRQARHLILVCGEYPKRLAWSLSLPLQNESELSGLESLLYLVCMLQHPEDEENEGPSLLPSDS